MDNPRVEVDLYKLKHNSECIVEMCKKNNINVMGVTKVFCAIPQIAEAMVAGGVTFLADSRIENIIGLSNIEIPKVLLRIPMHSEIEQLVTYADYSLNSELSTIEKISKESMKQNKKHKIILMVDLGDLREGVWYEDVGKTVGEIVNLGGIEIAGIGTNLTCYGGVIPSNKNLSVLSDIAVQLREKFKFPIPVVSGGNSSSIHLIEKGQMPSGINNLRIGEAIVLGRETAFGKRLTGLYDDVFTLYGETIEIKNKPSVPLGDVGMDAFGGTPKFVDKGMRNRAIIAIGRQDIKFDDLIPVDKNVQVLGASSDHLIIDITDSNKDYAVGKEIAFRMGYGSLLHSMTSRYVRKVIKNSES